LAITFFDRTEFFYMGQTILSLPVMMASRLGAFGSLAKKGHILYINRLESRSFSTTEVTLRHNQEVSQQPHPENVKESGAH
jgi:hypothetical protein